MTMATVTAGDPLEIRSEQILSYYKFSPVFAISTPQKSPGDTARMPRALCCVDKDLHCSYYNSLQDAI